MTDIPAIASPVTVRMLREYALVRHVPQTERRAGSLIIPGVREEKLMTGVIVACGSGYVDRDALKIIPLEIKPGDIVMFNNWAMSKPLIVNGETLYVMEEADMHLVLEKA